MFVCVTDGLGISLMHVCVCDRWSGHQPYACLCVCRWSGHQPYACLCVCDRWSGHPPYACLCVWQMVWASALCMFVCVWQMVLASALCMFVCVTDGLGIRLMHVCVCVTEGLGIRRMHVCVCDRWSRHPPWWYSTHDTSSQACYRLQPWGLRIWAKTHPGEHLTDTSNSAVLYGGVLTSCHGIISLPVVVSAIERVCWDAAEPV